MGNGSVYVTHGEDDDLEDPVHLTAPFAGGALHRLSRCRRRRLVAVPIPRDPAHVTTRAVPWNHRTPARDCGLKDIDLARYMGW